MSHDVAAVSIPEFPIPSVAPGRRIKHIKRVKLAKPTKPANLVGRDGRSALQSSASANWGTPDVGRRFAAAVLRPAATGKTAIDLDIASSAYWNRQWSLSDRPAKFFDGSEYLDALNREHWISMIGCIGKNGAIGAGFCNPPSSSDSDDSTTGDALGGVAKQFWRIVEGMYCERRLGSVVWVGFSFDQLRTLIPKLATDKGMLHPLHPNVSTIVPDKRIAYMSTPAQMIAMIDKRVARSKGKKVSSEIARVLKRRAELQTLIDRKDDSPVLGPSPTHSSFFTVLWHQDPTIRRTQFAAMHEFLAEEAKDPKSKFARAYVIGATA